MAMGCNGSDAKTMMESKQQESSVTVDDDVFPANFAEVVASLPRAPPCLMLPSIRRYRGFWLPDGVLLNLPSVHAFFQEQRRRRAPADTILLASFPKSGTTWLKALAFATARRSVHSPLHGAAGHPLLSRISHECVKFLDTLPSPLQSDGDGDNGDTATPRLLGTHLPYSLLPKRATADDDGSGCRIVYVARDPKDTLVSMWHFDARTGARTKEDGGGGGDAGEGTQPRTAAGAPTMEFKEAFEVFCQGYSVAGPQWEHVREYWEASKKRPGSVLFLRYEEMLQDPAGNLRKMAEFMGCPFSAAEDDAGVARSIVELCSLDRQRSLPANETGTYVEDLDGMVIITEKKLFFRKGIVGDWRNHMTPEMAARLDGIVEEALQGSGFTFGNTTIASS